ncbi:MAG: TetR/AcrR family transcriptional regulator [Anaerolineaceae bacterium]|nr:TetR/AcrR family transcriptional regulator [Anaerolineaceae bacterium]
MVRTVKKPEIRRQEIIESASQLFQTKTFAGTSMQDVMSMLDIAKGTIYHYFKSKEELLEAVTKYIIDQDVKQKEALLETLQGNALQKLATMIMMNTTAAEHNEVMQQLHQPANLALHTRLLVQALIKQAPIYASLIEQGIEEGIFLCEHPLESAEFILTAFQFLTDTGISNWSAEDMQRRTLAFPTMIEAQLGAAKGSFQFLIENL